MAKKKKIINTNKEKLKPTTAKSGSTVASVSSEPSSMLFGRENFKWVLIGIALIALGMLLMSGGGMPSPDVWDEGRIYGFRRLTLAPIVILAGLGVEIYAIFKK